MPAVVLVHGSFHGSWCWSLVTEQLAARGILSVAVDLDGHGLKSLSPASRWARPFDPAAFAAEPSGLQAVTASSAAGTLVRQIRVIGGGMPCVVVAHSMGGVPLQRGPDLIMKAVIYRGNGGPGVLEFVDRYLPVPVRVRPASGSP